VAAKPEERGSGGRSLGQGTRALRWFGHDPQRWEELERRYAAEIAGRTQSLTSLRDKARRGTVTLLHASRETRYNNARALRTLLERSG
jgi:uncharacterized protein YeaO (DUF488 family)